MYQGVRVKITVKELLQQRRARQAATGSAVSKNIWWCLLCTFFFNIFFFAKTGPKSGCNRLVRMGEKNVQSEWLQQ